MYRTDLYNNVLYPNTIDPHPLSPHTEETSLEHRHYEVRERVMDKNNTTTDIADIFGRQNTPEGTAMLTASGLHIGQYEILTVLY